MKLEQKIAADVRDVLEAKEAAERWKAKFDDETRKVPDEHFGCRRRAAF